MLFFGDDASDDYYIAAESQKSVNLLTRVYQFTNRCLESERNLFIYIFKQIFVPFLDIMMSGMKSGRRVCREARSAPLRKSFFST